MNDSNRWIHIERVWSAASAIDAKDRAAFLDGACAGDDALRREVDSLLANEEASETFLERPALHELAAMHAADGRSMIGREIGGYRIDTLLGVGGMGEVYRAVEVRLGRDVALKVLSRSLADPSDIRRFEEEARAASCLNHPNIVTIYGVGEAGNIVYIAMELVRGRTLRAVVADPPTAKQALDYAVQLADALAAAHTARIVHRDLKPENVMVTSEGLVKVLDFGIAKRTTEPEVQLRAPSQANATDNLTEHGTILGTAAYMSPEQAMGRELDHRSDQFSFGAILYELLSGRHAFERQTREETIAAIIADKPAPIASVNAGAAAAFQQVIVRCLAKTPAGRYASTRDLAADLRAIREEWHDSATPLTRRRAIGLGAAAALAAAAFGVTSWRLWSRSAVRTLAVLPFANPLGDENVEYLCEGIADSLIRRLSLVPSLKVTALGTVMHFRTADASSLGHQLNVDAVFTGTVTRRGGRLIVRTELIEVESGARLWGDVFDRPQADVIAVQDEIADGIAQAFNVRLDPNDQRRIARTLTTDAQTYDLYLQAVHHFRLEREEDYLLARDLLKRVVVQDRQFALGYVTLASTYSVMVIDGYESPRLAWPESTANIARALDLDPDLPDAHAEATAAEFYYRWNWAAAEREWQAALRSPRGEVQPELLTACALQKWALGRDADALEFARAARLADPLSALCMLREADLLAKTHQYDAAASLYDKIIADTPDDPRAYFGLADLRATQGRFDEAIDVRRRVHQPGVEESLDVLLSTARGAAGYRLIEQADAGLELARLRVRSANGSYVSPLDYARVHARMGDKESAFSFLASALEDHAAGLVFLNVDPAWVAVRDDARFAEAVRTVGLPNRR